MQQRWLDRLALALCVCALASVLSACRRRVPDVGGLTPVLQEDGRIVELLMEADALGEHDPQAAARNLRETVLPRARSNWETAGHVVVQHPRADVLRGEMVRITADRVATIDAYASALEHSDPQALHDVIHRQAELDQAMDRLEGDVANATRAPADRSCNVARVR